jgi:hypothetical protein
MAMRTLQRLNEIIPTLNGNTVGHIAALYLSQILDHMNANRELDNFDEAVLQECKSSHPSEHIRELARDLLHHAGVK